MYVCVCIEWRTWEFSTRNDKNGPLVQGDYYKTRSFLASESLFLSVSLPLSETTCLVLFARLREMRHGSLVLVCFYFMNIWQVWCWWWYGKVLSSRKGRAMAVLFITPVFLAPRWSPAQNRCSESICDLNTWILVSNGRGRESRNILLGLPAQRAKDKAFMLPPALGPQTATSRCLLYLSLAARHCGNHREVKLLSVTSFCCSNFPRSRASQTTV